MHVTLWGVRTYVDGGGGYAVDGVGGMPGCLISRHSWRVKMGGVLLPIAQPALLA